MHPTRPPPREVSRHSFRSRFRTALFVAALGLLPVTNIIAANGKDAQIHRSQHPITDAQGRVQMIIDFDFDPKSDTEFPHGTSPADEKKWDQHQGKIVNLLNQYEKLYGFTRSGMTSWAKVSATAYLDTTQIDKLVKDKRVSLLTENQFENFSVWTNTVVDNDDPVNISLSD